MLNIEAESVKEILKILKYWPILFLMKDSIKDYTSSNKNDVDSMEHNKRIKMVLNQRS